MAGIILTQLYQARDAVLLANYNAALLSTCLMVLLGTNSYEIVSCFLLQTPDPLYLSPDDNSVGFCDDVLDLPWRYKLVFPMIASMPLIATYRGGTTVLMPVAVRSERTGGLSF
jgi:UDP-N-acetylmuramyl pentapeptide phosphotransferase/UDP-N-acetylglucosamine-1-phosphate transferase